MSGDGGGDPSARLVKVKRVELAAIQLLESLSHMIKKQPQLILVIPADQLARRPPPSPLTHDLPNPDRIAHERNLPPTNTPAKCRFDRKHKSELVGSPGRRGTLAFTRKRACHPIGEMRNQW